MGVGIKVDFVLPCFSNFFKEKCAQIIRRMCAPTVLIIHGHSRALFLFLTMLPVEGSWIVVYYTPVKQEVRSTLNFASYYQVQLAAFSRKYTKKLRRNCVLRQ